MIELTINTKMAESKIGSHSDIKETMIHSLFKVTLNLLNNSQLQITYKDY